MKDRSYLGAVLFYSISDKKKEHREVLPLFTLFYE